MEYAGLLGGDPADCPSCNGDSWEGEIEGGDNVKEEPRHDESGGGIAGIDGVISKDSGWGGGSILDKVMTGEQAS